MTVNELIMALKYEDPNAEVLFKDITGKQAFIIEELEADKKKNKVFLLPISKENIKEFMNEY